jgi:Taurine catabolism dioxygenase TauD, TfdA family
MVSGENLVLHNRTVLHARTDYVDWPEMHRRRHLLRVWIDAPNALPVHPSHELGDFFAARGT